MSNAELIREHHDDEMRTHTPSRQELLHDFWQADAEAKRMQARAQRAEARAHQLWALANPDTGHGRQASEIATACSERAKEWEGMAVQADANAKAAL